MNRGLPYPGHTWSFSQHAVGINPETLYDFLKCAAPFEGHHEEYDKNITELMIESNILTPNKRDGSPDAWRDYQQILAELGLIYSTKIHRSLKITDIGQMYLAGEIGFSELIGIQCLRYQYPNGQKSTIQQRLKEELSGKKINYPETLIELQCNYGVLLKPGNLVFRILIELLNKSEYPTLSASECQAFLLPCRRNEDWEISYSEIVANRKTNTDQSSINRHSRRNIQDWFKFLSKSDFFFLNSNGDISLSRYAIENIDTCENLCRAEEEINSYWIPDGFSTQSKIKWFDWFGSIPEDINNAIRPEYLLTPEYINKNFIAGLDDTDNNGEGTNPSSVEINLKDIDFEYLGRNTLLNDQVDIEKIATNIRNGMHKRHAKALLHDRIIKSLSEKFKSQGAKVFADPESIDLLSIWPDGKSALFEVKTVTRRSIQNRIRSAIGQIEEYAYRRKVSGFRDDEKVIVLNSSIEKDAWQIEFLNSHLKIGLLCKMPNNQIAYAPECSETISYWST